VLGKADVLVVPDTVTVEPGRTAQGVPLAVMSIASAVADLFEEYEPSRRAASNRGGGKASAAVRQAEKAGAQSTMRMYKPCCRVIITLSYLAVVRPFAAKELRGEECRNILELRALRLPRRRPQTLLAALRRENMSNYESVKSATRCSSTIQPSFAVIG
jgi:hypothetical protein